MFTTWENLLSSSRFYQILMDHILSLAHKDCGRYALMTGTIRITSGRSSSHLLSLLLLDSSTYDREEKTYNVSERRRTETSEMVG
jgi:hypothetical protein